MPRAQVLALFGPTAVGKSALAHAAALELGGEIIVADPFQRYRGLEIAADAPGERERVEVPYHFVGDLDLTERSSAGEFASAAERRIADIIDRGRVPIVSGGSGLYVRSAVADIEFAPPVDPSTRESVEALVASDPLAAARELAERDPGEHARVDIQNPRRLARALEIARAGRRRDDELRSAPDRRPTALVAVTRPIEYLTALIGLRVERELRDGLVDEIARALDTPGVSREATQIIGASEVRRMREGALTEQELPARLASRTRRLAKRQEAWLRLMDPRDRVELDTWPDPCVGLPEVLAAWEAR